MTSSHTLEAAAQNLLPNLAAAARATHEKGLTADAIQTLVAAGLTRIYQPGLAVSSWGTHIAVARILARACATTSWIVTHLAEANRMIAMMPAQVQRGVWSTDATSVAVLADANTRITARQDGDQVYVTGTWAFVPALEHATWVVLRGHTAAGPMALLVPAKSLSGQPTDHMGGLRGCGFQRVDVQNLAVPASHTLTPEILLPDAPFQSAAPLGSILGGAEGGYADYVAITRKRVSGTGAGAVAKLTQVQIRLAEAQSEMDAAEAGVDAIVQRLQSTQIIDNDLRIRLARDGAVVAHRCIRALTQLVHQMGALGLAETNPVQRHYRDLRAMSSDRRVNWDLNLAAFGRHELGVPENLAPAAHAAA